jgi:chaperonin GroES
MELKPYYDRVLLKRKDAETKSKGGIHLTDGSTDKQNICTVVAVGPGYLNAETGETTPLKTETGSTVLIGKWAGDAVKMGDVEHLLVKESEILAQVVGA